MTRLSVVIPAYNAADGLRTCLRSLESQVLSPEDSYDVIVVDDGSTDDTGAVVEDPGWRFPVHYLHLPRTEQSGRSRARNTGIRAATGDVIVMVDADEIVPPGFLAQHARPHRRRDDLVVVGPRHHLAGRRLGPDDLTSLFNGDHDALVAKRDSRDALLAVLSHNFNNLATGWHHMFSCNASVRREHLLHVGGFDEDFTGWGLEDSELGYRLHRRGIAFAYVPDAVIYHQHRQAIDARMHAEWRRNLTRFVAKHPEPDVAAQWVIEPSVDPAADQLSWVECALRLEFAVRAVRGRLPWVRYRLIEVDHGDRDAAVAFVEQHAADTDLLIIDHLADPELRALVQTVATRRELLYFPCPDSTELARILATWPLEQAAERGV
ncbi:MAG: glycosyltransferase [Actinophytocola sp.]|uniref:glycosyltransferase family 2 protein n=1 Tax=Actinophytocola sp. TaxID=1872138 RepID=UPI003C73664D